MQEPSAGPNLRQVGLIAAAEAARAWARQRRAVWTEGGDALPPFVPLVAAAFAAGREPGVADPVRDVPPRAAKLANRLRGLREHVARSSRSGLAVGLRAARASRDSGRPGAEACCGNDRSCGCRARRRVDRADGMALCAYSVHDRHAGHGFHARRCGRQHRRHLDWEDADDPRIPGRSSPHRVQRPRREAPRPPRYRRATQEYSQRRLERQARRTPPGAIRSARRRTKRDARVGQQQAKLYADCLEKQFGQRPIIFYSNGYEHWIWDDQNYPPAFGAGLLCEGRVQGGSIQRRTTRTSLGATEINKGIVERFYQERAIRRIGEAFEKDHDRKALVVMATGAGKTRTVVALCDLMMRCNWVKRVLFLADRIALVKQTTRVYTRFLPSASAVNAMENPEQIAEARVLVSTYPTMLRLIDETKDGRRKFGPGHFDLVTVQVPTCLVLDKSGPISKAMVDECENWATNRRHRWPC